MSEKQVMDFAIYMSCLASIILSIVYIDNYLIKLPVIGVLLIMAVYFMVDNGRIELMLKKYEKEGLSEIILLSEEDTEVSIWDIWGRTSVTFGLSDRNNIVDVDLSKTAYAGLIDKEHAVMNFYNGDWYIEDLSSENGIYIQKAGTDDKVKLSNAPCKIEQDDVIYLGITRLRIR